MRRLIAIVSAAALLLGLCLAVGADPSYARENSVASSSLEESTVKAILALEPWDASVKASQSAFPTGTNTVVIAGVDNSTDAFCASVLARAYAGPLLLTPSAGLTAGLAAELERLHPSKVFLVGAPEGGTLWNQVTRVAGIHAVDTLVGSDRYHTAALVAYQIAIKTGTPSKAVLVPGDSFADALMVTPLAVAQGWPLLFTPGENLQPMTQSTIANLDVPSVLEVGTRAQVRGVEIDRIVGLNRFDTLAKVDEYAAGLGIEIGYVAFALTADSPDALALAPYMALNGGIPNASGGREDTSQAKESNEVKGTSVPTSGETPVQLSEASLFYSIADLAAVLPTQALPSSATTVPTYYPPADPYSPPADEITTQPGADAWSGQLWWVNPGSTFSPNIVTTLPEITTIPEVPDTSTSALPTTTTANPADVTLKAGTYGPLVYTGRAVKIIGEGVGRTIIRADNMDAIIKLTGCSSIEIAHVTIQGNYSRTGQVGIQFKGSNPSVYVHDIEIKDVGSCGIINDIGSLLTGTFQRMNVTHCGDFGMQLRQGAKDVQLLDSTWSNFASRRYPGHAIYFDDVNGGVIARHTISGLPAAAGKYEISGVKVTRESNTPNSGIVVEDVTVSSAVCAVSLPYAKNVTVRRCVGTNIFTRGVYMISGGDNLIIEDCRMTAPVGYLIYADFGAPTNVTVRRCSAPGSARAYDWDGVPVRMEANTW